MKTAMQDIQNMLEILWANTDVVTIESVLDYIRDKGIPSEKEQIIYSFDYGYHCASNGTSAEITLDGKMHYNQTYN